jgi:hypothetical protein
MAFLFTVIEPYEAGTDGLLPKRHWTDAYLDVGAQIQKMIS